MSEDTDAKASRRRRTTRAGRRRLAGRVSSEAPDPDNSGERWSPSWSSDPDTVPLDEDFEHEAEAADAAVDRETMGQGEDAPRLARITPDAGADARDARDAIAAPLSLVDARDDEKTNPRIRVGDMGPEHPIELEPDSAPTVKIWRRPSRRHTSDDSLPIVKPAVVITPSRVISDRPPPMHAAREAEVARTALPERAPASAHEGASAPSPRAFGQGEPAPERPMQPEPERAVHAEPVRARHAEPEHGAVAAPDPARHPEPEHAVQSEPERALHREPEHAPQPEHEHALHRESEHARQPDHVQQPEAEHAPQPEAAPHREPEHALLAEPEQALHAEPEPALQPEPAPQPEPERAARPGVPRSQERAQLAPPQAERLMEPEPDRPATASAPEPEPELERIAQSAPEPQARQVEPERPAPPPPRRAVETSFEPFDETQDLPAAEPSTPAAEAKTASAAAAPPVPAASAAQPAPAAASRRPATQPHGATDEGGLTIVDVEVAELERARRSRTPPPPPPDARSKSAPKRPPPPPAPPSKAEDERQKRKQVRQWWERFFSDDYLMSVRPATPAQIAKQVDFIEQSLSIGKGGTVLDVGCGLGLHAVELTRRGYLVVGLDLSLAMITRAAELAQQQQLKLNVVHADIREMEFDGAFDGVICMGTTFGFFDDEANRDMLARIHQALRPGGRLLLDIVNRDYVINLQPNLVWFEGDECVCMEESDFNYFNSRLTVKRTMMREDGKQSNAEYSVRLYSLHELGMFMQQVGFRVIEVSGQEAVRGAFFGANSPRVLMLAERRPIGRPSAVIPLERSSVEQPRPQAPMPPERGSSEIPKIPKPE